MSIRAPSLSTLPPPSPVEHWSVTSWSVSKGCSELQGGRLPCFSISATFERWLRWTSVFLKKPEVYFRCLSLVLWDRPSLHQRMSFEPNRSIPLVMFRGPLLPNCGFNYPCFSESVEVPRMEPLEILRPTCNCSDIINHCSYFWVRDNTSPKNTSGVWL